MRPLPETMGAKVNNPTARPTLLIVDDDTLITDTLAYVLGKDFEVLVSDSRAHAISLLRQLDAPPQLALVDLGLPPHPHRPDEGFHLISDLLAHSKLMKIVVLSGQNDEANARHARTLGANEFIAKPCDAEELRAVLRKSLEIRDAELKPAPAETQDGLGLIGESMPMQKLRAQIRQYADSPFPVLIEGESGSGKELIASALHRLGSRAERPLLALNCAAISPTLVEPTLFGYAKGAFTGANTSKSGYFEDAADGTLFLDEIGELPLELQAKLLRVLENGEYQRVGETQNRVSQARVIAATNRDLRAETRQNTFRTDLYHRLSVLSMTVPPLREMGEDRELLLRYFRRFYCEQGKLAPFELQAEAMKLWLSYEFPGNVRELRNIVIRLATKYPGISVGAADLETEFDVSAGPDELESAPQSTASAIEIARKHLQQPGRFSLDEVLATWEKAYIEAALKLTHGNMSQAAKLLGVNRTTLYSRMETIGKEADAGG
jgi:DNA-binding NtrC family response regulator